MMFNSQFVESWSTLRFSYYCLRKSWPCVNLGRHCNGFHRSVIIGCVRAFAGICEGKYDFFECPMGNILSKNLFHTPFQNCDNFHQFGLIDAIFDLARNWQLEIRTHLDLNTHHLSPFYLHVESASPFHIFMGSSYSEIYHEKGQAPNQEWRELNKFWEIGSHLAHCEDYVTIIVFCTHQCFIFWVNRLNFVESFIASHTRVTIKYNQKANT